MKQSKHPNLSGVIQTLILISLIKSAYADSSSKNNKGKDGNNKDNIIDIKNINIDGQQLPNIHYEGPFGRIHMNVNVGPNIERKHSYTKEERSRLFQEKKEHLEKQQHPTHEKPNYKHR